MKILKIENFNDYISILIEDKKEKICFWIDCCKIDGYGNRNNYKTDDLYIDWKFNQYIFILDNEKDIKLKEYQENYNNIDKIQNFIDEKNDYLLKQFKKKKKEKKENGKI